MQMVSARRNFSGSFEDDHTLTRPLLSASHHQVPDADSSVMQTNMDGGDKGADIQQLLAAEQEAQHIINNAKTSKATRLKQAKEEAEREVATYRVRRENEFQKKLAETSGDSGSNMKRLEAETCSKIQHLREEASKVSPEVVAMMIQCVTSIKI